MNRIPQFTYALFADRYGVFPTHQYRRIKCVALVNYSRIDEFSQSFSSSLNKNTDNFFAGELGQKFLYLNFSTIKDQRGCSVFLESFYFRYRSRFRCGNQNVLISKYFRRNRGAKFAINNNSYRVPQFIGTNSKMRIIHNSRRGADKDGLILAS